MRILFSFANENFDFAQRNPIYPPVIFMFEVTMGRWAGPLACWAEMTWVRWPNRQQTEEVSHSSSTTSSAPPVRLETPGCSLVHLRYQYISICGGQYCTYT